MITADHIKEIIRAGIEPSEPQNKILAYLRARDGKTLTKRDEQKMRTEIDPTIRIERRFGTTYVSWGSELGLLIARTEKAPTIDASWIEAANPGYFDARRERNASRERALQDDAAIGTLADAINAFNEAYKTIEALTSPGAIFDADRYALRDLMVKS